MATDLPHLGEWLLARLAEDERDASTPRAHRDVAAKRAIVAAHTSSLDDGGDAEWAVEEHLDPGCTWYALADHHIAYEHECPDLLRLAEVYADHPTHGQWWTPEVDAAPGVSHSVSVVLTVPPDAATSPTEARDYARRLIEAGLGAVNEHDGTSTTIGVAL